MVRRCYATGSQCALWTRCCDTLPAVQIGPGPMAVGEAIAHAGEAQKPARDVKGEPHVDRVRSALTSPAFTKRLRLLLIYHGFHQ